MKSPTLSVATCNYNHARFLPRSIESVVSQSRLPDEYILLDDGSTDDSAAIMASYASRYPFIRVLRHQQNAGLLACMRELLSETQSDYLFCLAADDFILPDFFEAAMCEAEQHPQAGIVFGQVMACDPDGSRFRACLTESFRGLPTSGYFAPQDFLLKYLDVEDANHSLSVATIYRKECLDELGGYRPELGAWTDTFALRAIGLKRGACFLNQPCAVVRIMGDGFSSSAQRNPRHMLDVVERAAWLMRSAEFRAFFPEWHVQKWRNGYREFIIRNCGGIEMQYDHAGATYLKMLSSGRALDQRMGLLLMKFTGGFRKLQVAWLRHCLRRYEPDLSCYKNASHRVSPRVEFQTR